MLPKHLHPIHGQSLEHCFQRERGEGGRELLSLGEESSQPVGVIPSGNPTLVGAWRNTRETHKIRSVPQEVSLQPH